MCVYVDVQMTKIEHLRNTHIRINPDICIKTHFKKSANLHIRTFAH